jgi:hypothetical protein
LAKIVLAGSEIVAQTLFGISTILPRFLNGGWSTRNRDFPTRRSFSIMKIGSDLHQFCLGFLTEVFYERKDQGLGGGLSLQICSTARRGSWRSKGLDFWGNKTINRNIRLVVIRIIGHGTTGTVKLRLANNGWHGNLQKNNKKQKE